MKKLAAALLLLSLTQSAMSQTDDELKKTFREHIEIENAGSSVVMVEVSEQGSRFVSYGALSKDAAAKTADEKTIYEIGSITKVFVGVLLADAVRRGEVKLDDPISKYLPKTVEVPKFTGKEITLVDLATHTSALPRLPDNLAPKNGLDPYVDYTANNAYDFLSGYKLTREIGTQYEYSNYAVGLLGHILSLRAKMSLEKLMTTRILKPLGMNDTSFVVPKTKEARFAQGLNEANEPTPHWNFDVLAGAGALRSTAADMAKFIAANVGLTKTPLAPSLAEARKMLRQGQSKSSKVGLCWNDIDLSGTQIFWHGGGTYGFSSYVAIAPGKKRGAFLARNWGAPTGGMFLESVAFHSIEPKFAIKKPTPPKKEITLSEDVLEKYVGEYQIAPKFLIEITRQGTQLFAQATGQIKFELFPEKEDEFFAKITQLSITFNKDESGKVTGLIIHQGGRDTPASKIK